MTDNSIKTTVDELKKLLNVRNFVGDPIETEDKILIPFMKWGFGFGAGQVNSSDSDNGFGSGAGAGIEPISIVVVDKKLEGMDGVRVLNLTKATETSKAISELGIVATDLIKEIISNYNEQTDKSNSEFANNLNEDYTEVKDSE
ncbi:MAG: sporulation protein [Methanobrevibacter arboriphilus]|mgnify:CR=1 FL=1|jgi:uncharacterized spore protein YtfJ|uniref:Uncharacterized protein n=2 Tax=Methanobrevibacter arboriphilus TaxID=39441 RepID=A0ACA8R3R4_METAZ|nr:spore germination protein GerW family protein [Methanobrevibacter arboriphilus]MBF4467841.1 sporulation protein [Methanobrevibacter arboriphilus]MCC7562570.1 sporulation protein [Methanobrevibacter arboriphilus]BBL61852.1 hypothetical protein MarbSA_08920 [Methanobrevibacter arboriphilus]GLI10964.1 hypothetical protein MARBORIA2_00540 [Methanobrevibacter arboriphilus]